MYLISIAPYTAPISNKFSNDFFNEVFAGGVGNGNVNILLNPIALISSTTLYNGNLHIYGYGCWSIIFAYNADEYNR